MSTKPIDGHWTDFVQSSNQPDYSDEVKLSGAGGGAQRPVAVQIHEKISWQSGQREDEVRETHVENIGIERGPQRGMLHVNDDEEEIAEHGADKGDEEEPSGHRRRDVQRSCTDNFFVRRTTIMRAGMREVRGKKDVGAGNVIQNDFLHGFVRRNCSKWITLCQ